MFQHIVYSLANREVLFVYTRTCKIRLNTTNTFMVAVTSLFNSIMYNQHVWLLIYHDSFKNVVQVCSFLDSLFQLIHEQACQQHYSSRQAQLCSSLLIKKQKQAVRFYVLYRFVNNCWIRITIYRPIYTIRFVIHDCRHVFCD